MRGKEAKDLTHDSDRLCKVESGTIIQNDGWGLKAGRGGKGLRRAILGEPRGDVILKSLFGE